MHPQPKLKVPNSPDSLIFVGAKKPDAQRTFPRFFAHPFRLFQLLRVSGKHF
jgi:hypothetical protein